MLSEREVAVISLKMFDLMKSVFSGLLVWMSFPEDSSTGLEV